MAGSDWRDFPLLAAMKKRIDEISAMVRTKRDRR
jgi:hypothetical protein